MPKGKPSQHAEILEYALSHLETERDNIQSKIDAIRQELRTGKSAPARKSVASAAAAPAAASAPATATRKKRVLSESARKRIAAAQKRRWAEHRKQQKVG
jgi:hypothetical protein